MASYGPGVPRLAHQLGSTVTLGRWSEGRPRMSPNEATVRAQQRLAVSLHVISKTHAGVT